MPKRRKDSFVQSSLGGNDNGQTAEGSSANSVAADHLQQQQQQQTKLNEKCAKMEMELTVAKLEFENGALKAESKQREMMDELEALKKKMAKMEEQKEAAEERFSQLQNDQKKIVEKIIELEKQQKEQSKATAEQLPKIVEKVIEMDKEPKQKRTKAFQEEIEKKVMERIDVTVQTKVDKMEMAHQQQKVVTEKAIFERIAAEERFLQLQNDQKKILEKISETEKQRKKKVFLKFQENCWDSFACDNLIEISGDKNLIVHHKGPSAWRSVFAKYPIVLNKHLSDFFYYEISVQKKEKSNWVMFGFAVKQQTKLDGPIHREKGTYAFYSNGYIWINGKGKGRNAEYSYGVGDTVGIGVNSASRQMIFTKNGLRLDTSDFLVDPSFADGSLNPFVSLLFPGDKIEANFGPNFKFDLATL
ncbi:hypothetical protein niasHS_011454 [Heterodera schachtii]|uniref:B30.2/SPRY domain-containing protein n=1 Tax=Heterodera schachtii TaxID=97005 RepID=A0ABD2IQW0_HETSC